MPIYFYLHFCVCLACDITAWYVTYILTHLKKTKKCQFLGQYLCFTKLADPLVTTRFFETMSRKLTDKIIDRFLKMFNDHCDRKGTRGESFHMDKTIERFTVKCYGDGLHSKRGCHRINPFWASAQFYSFLYPIIFRGYRNGHWLKKV